MAPRALSFAQLGLSVLCLCLSASIIGTAADALRTYKQERDALNPWWLPLWPDHFNIDGTPALIGIAATITVLHLIYIIATAVPRFTLFQTPKFSWLLTMSVAIPSLLLSLIAIIFVHILNNNSDNHTNKDTILTWTCKFRNAEPAGGNLRVEKIMTNESFGKLCDESRFAYYAMVPVLVLQVVMIAVSFVQWRSAGASVREQEKMYEGTPERESPVEFTVHSK